MVSFFDGVSFLGFMIFHYTNFSTYSKPIAPALTFGSSQDNVEVVIPSDMMEILCQSMSPSSRDTFI